MLFLNKLTAAEHLYPRVISIKVTLMKANKTVKPHRSKRAQAVFIRQIVFQDKAKIVYPLTYGRHAPRLCIVGSKESNRFKHGIIFKRKI